jgi:hypothetical protein
MDKIVGIVVGGREFCDEVAVLLRAHATLTPARTVPGAVRIAARLMPLLAVLAELVFGATPVDEFAPLRAIAPGVRSIVVTTTTDTARLVNLASIGAILKHPIDAARLNVAVTNALRLSAMVTGVRKMQQSSRLDADPGAAERASVKNDRVKDGS